MYGNYRPLKFGQVVGQDIAKKLIKNALIQQKLPRVIMLYGPSGTGKTTLARLIVAWYVCENRGDDVCGECNMCRAVQNGSLVDMLELDAASNTSIEDIREILDQCTYVPQYAKEKIFVIDEAHMLSRNAIAALLKTFEETASHVRFILATTELEKIPDAIRSRCFCVPLYSVQADGIRAHLTNLASANNIALEEQACDLLVKLSHGSLREAISMLEQAMLVCKDNKIQLEFLHEIIAFAKEDEVNKLVADIEAKDFLQTFEDASRLIEHDSIAPLSLLLQLINTFKDKLANANETEQKRQCLKILIDLNKLYQDAMRISAVAELVIVGLAEIAYSHE